MAINEALADHERSTEMLSAELARLDLAEFLATADRLAASVSLLEVVAED